MARPPLPPYMVAYGGYSDFESLLASGDAGAMKNLAARSEKWLQDPANADANDPQVSDERERLKQIKAEIALLEDAPAPVGAA